MTAMPYTSRIKLAIRPRERGGYSGQHLVARVVSGRSALRAGEVLVELNLTVPVEIFRGAKVDVQVPAPAVRADVEV